MSDAHADPKVPARVPAEDLAVGRQELAERRWTVQEFVIACFRTLRSDADALVMLVSPNRPAPKPRGRPPKKSEQP